MVYITNSVIASYNVLDTERSERNSDSSFSYTETTLFGFFISPSLKIEYEEKPESARIFCPAQRYLVQDGSSFERKFLRICVRNTGFVSAKNCEAKMRILSNNDVKQLVWEGSASSSVLEGISLRKDIHARRGEELVHVSFSDSRFTNLADENFRVFSWASTMRAIPPQNVLSLEDRLDGSEVEITILSEEGAFCKSIFRIHADTNHLSLRMDKISDESGGKWSKFRRKRP
jgi:hypothetical protein